MWFRQSVLQCLRRDHPILLAGVDGVYLSCQLAQDADYQLCQVVGSSCQSRSANGFSQRLRTCFVPQGRAGQDRTGPGY